MLAFVMASMSSSSPVAPSSHRRPEVADLSRNDLIAARLGEAADLLSARNANPFRVAAYRRAAQTIGQLDRDVGELEREGGQKALDEIPNVGPGIVRAIAQILETGRWPYLERLRAETGPEVLFRTISRGWTDIGQAPP